MSLIPTTMQWRTWSLPSKLTAIGTALAVLSIVIYFAEKAFGLVSHALSKTPPPAVSYGLVSHPERIAVGTEIHKVKWQADFSPHTFVIQNDSYHTSITDVRVDLALPGGVVTHELQAVEGCQDVVFSLPNTDGGIARHGITDRRIRYYMNNPTISIARMSPRSRFTAFLVVAFRGDDDDPFWCDVTFSYSDRGRSVRCAFRHPIEVVSAAPFIMKVDLATNMANKSVITTLRMTPAKPLAFGPNGTIKEADSVPNNASEAIGDPGAPQPQR